MRMTRFSIENGLAFADEKLEELVLLAQHLDGKESDSYKQHLANFDALNS